MHTWQLDARLLADTFLVQTLPLSQLRLMNDAQYRWLILVPQVPDAVEILDLDTAQRAQLRAEIDLASKVLRALTCAHKLNIATLGNVVAQLHVHVIARFTDDAAWPAPVWGKHPAKAYDASARDAFIQRLQQQLQAHL